MIKRNGFTLLELMVALSVLAVIASTAVPGYKQIIQSAQKRTVSLDIKRSMIAAKRYAMASGKTVTVCASADNALCIKSPNWKNAPIVSFVDNNRNLVIDTDEKVVHITTARYAESNLYWRSFGNQSYIRWLPAGVTNWKPGSFVYCPANKNTKYALRIVMNGAGRTYLAPDRNNNGIPENDQNEDIVC